MQIEFLIPIFDCAVCLRDATKIAFLGVSSAVPLGHPEAETFERWMSHNQERQPVVKLRRQ